MLIDKKDGHWKGKHLVSRRATEATRAGREKGTDNAWRDRNPVSMTLERSTQTDAQEEGETLCVLMNFLAS